MKANKEGATFAAIDLGNEGGGVLMLQACKTNVYGGTRTDYEAAVVAMHRAAELMEAASSLLWDCGEQIPNWEE